MGAAPSERVDAAIVGGGAFGAWIGLCLARRGRSVVLVEREDALLRRASYSNQARVHNGYHYPRSILTGLRSRVNSSRFLAEFGDCTDTRFQMYYAVGRVRSNVTAAQFATFCRRIGARLGPVPRSIRELFTPELVEDVWEADEWAFDADALAANLRARLEAARVDVRLSTQAVRVAAGRSKRLALDVAGRADGRESTVEADFVFNCTYSNLNGLLAASGLPKIPLKQEFAEMALVEVPSEMKRIGVTVMCGPFFSFMPFPPLGLHTFSHVRYTPHHAWLDQDVAQDNLAYFDAASKASYYSFMQRDSARYMPIVSTFVQKSSLFELKTVLPASEADDSRPILFRRDQGLPGLVCVLGGKIDNVYDVERELEALLEGRGAA